MWCGTRTRIVIFEWASVAALWQGFGVCRDCVHYVVVLHRFGRATGGWASLAIIGNSERERGQNAVIFRFGELMNLAVFPLAKLEWTSTTGKGT